ncbi:adhesin [Streptomyces sp. NBC_00316]|uniref:adhesin n=1 Tax=Streptomyces sp. NBC_00316 TaxID=2975710 RepID=UPI002E2C3075|nr:adhesin [Streptomyces sp. NBC_00316]
MRCQRCGGEQRGALPGMVCPDCGSVARSAGGDGSWIARETLAGRISTLPRGGKVLLVAGVVVVAGSLVTGTSLLVSGGGGGDGRNTGAVGRAGVPRAGIGGGAPTRIGPSGTERPDPAPTSATSPTPSSPRSPSRTPAPSSDTGGHTYAAWAGPGCSTGEYREHGRFENGDNGWYTVASGGYRGSTCDGRFSAVPMSGSPTEDRGNTATWSWHLGSGYHECALTVFVPDSGRDRDVAGDPTVYRVLSDPDDADSAYTGFAVRQTVHRGSPVEVSSYPVKGNTFAVQLIDRGRDWGDEARVGAHHAAAQLKVDCR